MNIYLFHDINDGSKIANAIFRDRNSVFVKDRKTNKWYGTNADAFLEATNYAITRKGDFNAADFFWDYYVVRKKGNGYVVGSEDEYKKLPNHQKHLMSIYIRTKSIIVLLRDVDFFVPNTNIIRSRFPDSVLKHCHIKQVEHKLNDDDKKQLNAVYPNFSFHSLTLLTRPSSDWHGDNFANNDMVLLQNTKYNQIPNIKEDTTIIGTYPLTVSNLAYTEWLTSPPGILFKDVFKDIPGLLTDCEKLFDKNVLKIKKLEKEIADLNDVIFKETKIFYLYDDSNFISNTSFTELNKKIQCYGFISLFYTNSNYQLVNSTNRLKFNVLNNAQRDHLLFQLEDILSPYQIKITDSKISSFSILPSGKLNHTIIDQILIEGFQNFAQYDKINPVDIRITDPEIRSRLYFYSKKYKYRFIINSLLFSSAVQGNIKSIFITTNGLNDAKQILIKKILYQGIGVIFISEIENWDKIKNTSHWNNVLLTDSAFPTAAQYFAFAFEMTDLNSLLNFEFSLIMDKGELLKFADGEDKIPAINFTIQIV